MGTGRSSDHARGVREVAHEGRRLNLLPREATMESIELLEEGDKRMHTADSHRAVVFEDVEVFRKPFDEAEALRERRATLEPDIELRCAERSQRVCDPVVFLDEARGEFAILRDDLKQVIEFGGIVYEGHVVPSMSADSTRACVALVP